MKPSFEDYQALIMAQVWRKMAKHPTLDYDDLVSAGHLAFMRASKSWQSEKGAFSTHLTWELRHQMNRVLTKKVRSIEFVELSASNGPIEEPLGYLAASISCLSVDAQEVIWLIFNSGVELVDMTERLIRTTRGTIREYLSSKGWKEGKINLVFSEISMMLR